MSAPLPSPVQRIAHAVRARLRAEIGHAGGREVCFVADLDGDGTIVSADAVSRGTPEMVLALPGVASRGQMLLHNHPTGELEPSHADLSIAARLHEAGIGFGIINNDASELYVVTEVPVPRVTTAIDPFDVVGTLAEHGAVSRVLGQFEDRPSQRDMAAYIADGYNEGGVQVLEAGTGVGKSFAYLVPALAWARANSERTVISTNTINLQEQLVGKDLPLLKDALQCADHTPTFALLKGWRNYLCLARLEQAASAQQTLLEPERLDELLTVVEWAGHTADGTLSDLPFTPAMEVWDEVSAESDLCTRLKCSWYSKCFLFQARQRAAEADVVVVNHHLFAADLSVRLAQDNWIDAAVLPPYRRLILDEAHHLEDVAAEHLGTQVTSWGVRRLLGRFERNGKGLAPALAQELAARDDLMSRASLDLLQERLIPGLSTARRMADAMFARLQGHLANVSGGTLRLADEFQADEIWAQGLAGELDGAVSAFRQIKDVVETIADRLAQGEESERQQQLLKELRGLYRRLEGQEDGLNRTLRPVPGGDPVVRWMERWGQRGQHIRLATVPLDLAPILRELIFDRLETVVLTSATLAAGGDFDFLERRLGLAEAPSPVTVREILPSPFDFTGQCLFGIPNDMPDPRADESGHDAATAEIVAQLAAASDGGMFVLFTSHAALRRVGDLLRASLPVEWPLLVQGEAPRDALLRRFREAGNAILLGTDSFWEGVDVPGRALRALVLTKLPFKVPSEPVTSARLQRISEEGGDGFWQYLVPHAALKLKQGFGRLIRSRQDVGVVLLLDPRILTKRYGNIIRSGLPPATEIVGTWREVLIACEDFFARHGIGATW
jgi:ATP-dependent DNA helicase DinG